MMDMDEFNRKLPSCPLKLSMYLFPEQPGQVRYVDISIMKSLDFSQDEPATQLKRTIITMLKPKKSNENNQTLDASIYFQKFKGRRGGIHGIQLQMFVHLMLGAPHDKLAWNQVRKSWVQYWFPNFPLPFSLPNTLSPWNFVSNQTGHFITPIRPVNVNHYQTPSNLGEPLKPTVLFATQVTPFQIHQNHAAHLSVANDLSPISNSTSVQSSMTSAPSFDDQSQNTHLSVANDLCVISLEKLSTIDRTMTIGQLLAQLVDRFGEKILWQELFRVISGETPGSYLTFEAFAYVMKDMDRMSTGRRKKMLPLMLRPVLAAYLHNSESLIKYQLSVAEINGNTTEMLASVKRALSGIPCLPFPTRKEAQRVRKNIRLTFLRRLNVKNTYSGMRVSLIQFVEYAAEKAYGLTSYLVLK